LSPVVGIHPDALRELSDAIEWYNAGGRERGVRFRTDYDRVVDRCLEWPESGAIVHVPESQRIFRHAKVPQSHFRLVYYVTGDVLKVVAIAHERRRPLYWTDRD